MDHPRVITTAKFWKALVAAGVFREDESIQRVVIDAKMQNVVRMYIERAGDARLLDVVTTLEGVKVTTGTPAPHEHEWVSLRTVSDPDDPQACTQCDATRVVPL
jgi:hypothetical protein